MSAETSHQPGFDDEPHYHGHRERLRMRFRGAGTDALSDYELLEMVLFRALPRRDVKPLAKSLIGKFGSFAEVVHAPDARLREITQAIATAARTGKIGDGKIFVFDVLDAIRIRNDDTGEMAL